MQQKLIRLECSVCGRCEPINKERAARNLQNGWSKCCGYTMTLITENTDKARSANDEEATSDSETAMRLLRQDGSRP